MKTNLLEFENSLYEMFVAAVRIDANQCWNWTKQKAKGYGVFRYGRKTFKMSSHRYSYTVHKGAIPDGLVIDHLCRNKACCNPDHLEAVTQRENMARGLVVTRRKEVAKEVMRPIMLKAQAIAAELARTKTHCRNGHELKGDNVKLTQYKPGKFTRVCQECRRATRKREWQRFKAKQENLHKFNDSNPMVKA